MSRARAVRGSGAAGVPRRPATPSRTTPSLTTRRPPLELQVLSSGWVRLAVAGESGGPFALQLSASAICVLVNSAITDRTCRA